MARTKKPKAIPGGYVALPWKLLNSTAYRRLPFAARAMLPFFLGKVKILVTDPQYYHVEFSLSYGEAVHHGCARRTFSRIVTDLIGFGFVDPVHRGYKSLNVYRLSNRWEKYGTTGFKEVSWHDFRWDQFQKVVQKRRISGANNEPDKGIKQKLGCLK